MNIIITPGFPEMKEEKAGGLIVSKSFDRATGFFSSFLSQKNKFAYENVTK